MFQIVLSLAIGIIIGWNFHLFYNSLEPKSTTVFLSQKNSFDKQIPTSGTMSQEMNRSKEMMMLVSTPNHDQNQTVETPFAMLLYQDHFSDAMALYLDADEETLKEYKLILKTYFYDQANSDPIKTVERILHYIEIEPNSQDIKLYLAKLYREKSEFEKALNVLFELHDLNEEAYSKLVDNDLNTTIETYIEQLKENKDFSRLISFLKTLINRDLYNEKYMMLLANLYYELENYDKARELFEEITYDTTYGAKAQTMLTTLNAKKKEQQHYSHIVPLTKVGSQYSVTLILNNTPLTLLLDTGASYTFVDEDKVNSLQAEKEILLNTAGGEILAHLAKADSVRIQDLELTDFTVTVAPFKRDHADGLLGMNFLSQFDFKIDQDKQLLYLKKKVNK